MGKGRYHSHKRWGMKAVGCRRGTGYQRFVRRPYLKFILHHTSRLVNRILDKIQIFPVFTPFLPVKYKKREDGNSGTLKKNVR